MASELMFGLSFQLSDYYVVFAVEQKEKQFKMLQAEQYSNLFHELRVANTNIFPQTALFCNLT